MKRWQLTLALSLLALGGVGLASAVPVAGAIGYALASLRGPEPVVVRAIEPVSVVAALQAEPDFDEIVTTPAPPVAEVTAPLPPVTPPPAAPPTKVRPIHTTPRTRPEVVVVETLPPDPTPHRDPDYCPPCGRG